MLRTLAAGNHAEQEAERAGSGTGFTRQWRQRPIARRIIAEIRGVDVAAVVKEMEGEGKIANTIRLHLAVLSHLFTVAQGDWGMESLDNPVARVRKPRLPKGRERRVREGDRRLHYR